MAGAASARWRQPLPIFPTEGWAVVALLVAAFLIRLPSLGNPAIEIDEQFYLLVGDRMLHGAIPYVDIWDRKPIGLFLIYAGARLLGGDGYIQYQVLATLAAAGTACAIFAMARRTSGAAGAAFAGLLYLLWIETVEGGGGQSPIFYNLPMAMAAALLLSPEPRRTRARAFIAMALVGVAIQIKYSAIVEGAFFGLVAAGQSLRRSPHLALPETALLALTALAPTMAAFAVYTAMGHGDEFRFANFTSVFLRGPTPAGELHHRATTALLQILPLGICVAAATFHLLKTDPGRATSGWLLFMAGWIAAALVGFFAVGVLYYHYLLPAFVPLTIASAPIFRRRPSGPILAAIVAWLPAHSLHWPDFAATARAQSEIATLTALVPPGVRTGCMQMFDGPPVLYYATHACTISRYIFPDHLSAGNEAGAIGTDQVAEVRRILAARPLVIIIGDSDMPYPNRATLSIMRAGLAASYSRAGHTQVDGRFISVYVRR